MNLSNDYFLLFHGIQVKKRISYEINSINEMEFFEVAALILSTTRKSYEKYLPLKSFKELCTFIVKKDLKSLDELNQLQYNLIEIILNNSNHKNITKLHKTFEYLKKEKIISKTDYGKLISLFDLTNIEIIKKTPKTNNIKIDNKLNFEEHKTKLKNLIKDLETILYEDELKKELKQTITYINNQKFSIGITGIMNAGKSTMLNALMKEEILGSSVIPETANLTIISYDECPSAKVFYWSKKEWEKIKNSALEIKSIKEFIDETKLIFKDNISNYIQDKRKSEDININELLTYTSAQKSKGKCNLIKYVKLKSNLSFLKDGIELVDTPGLDDPVIQREEITKEYLNRCDLMIHLMNVSQSATLKDVEFIIDALLYQNITKLLVVITRADTVTKKQLEEVIEYTKVSIKRQLKEINKDNQLDYILKTIEFVPISAKMALLHRTKREKEALKAGFKIEDTGILEVENYLNDSLFGKNSSKIELIIKNAKAQIIKIINKQHDKLNYELILSSKSKSELKSELEEFSKKRIKDEKILTSMAEDIKYYKIEAKDHIKFLETFLKTQLIDLQTIIRQRVISDVKYTFEKEKKLPQNNRVISIIQTAIKDGIIDIIREYRYKFTKKSQRTIEICEQKYYDYSLKSNSSDDTHFDTMGFFQQAFKQGFLTTSNDVLISKIIALVSKSKASKLDELSLKIEQLLKKEFLNIEDDLMNKTTKISTLLITSFFEKLDSQLKYFQNRLENNEKILQNKIELFEQNSVNKDELSINIHKKIKKLESIKRACKK